MKIGVISDTHNLLREEVIENLKECNMIIHAGDICDKEILTRLNKIAKTIAVKGNNDSGEFGKSLPRFEVVKILDKLAYIVHDIKDLPDNLEGIDIVIYGHSHKYVNDKRNGVLYLNPGSCGKRRFSLPLSMIIMDIDEENMIIKRIDIDV